MTARELGIKLPRLRAWRLRMLLTQEQLAGRAHVGRSTVIRAERGGATSLAHVRALADGLGISVDALRDVDPDAGSRPAKVRGAA